MILTKEQQAILDGEKGERGDNGINGKDGVDGADGKDADSTIVLICLIIASVSMLGTIILTAYTISQNKRRKSS